MNFWQGRNIRLRAVEPEDADVFYEWNQDSDMLKNVDNIWFPVSRESQRAFAQRKATAEQNDACYFLIENVDGEIAGDIGAHSCDRRVGCFRYSVSMREEYKRRGYATEAILLFLKYYFQELRYQKVTVDIRSFNEASVRLHEKLGFKREGCIRRVAYTGGKYYDSFVYGMTYEEFQEKYGTDE